MDVLHGPKPKGVVKSQLSAKYSHTTFACPDPLRNMYKICTEQAPIKMFGKRAPIGRCHFWDPSGIL